METSVQLFITGTLYHLRNLTKRRNVVKKPEKSVTACEDFFQLVCEAHICSQLFTFQRGVPEGCAQLNPKQHWNVLQLGVKNIVDQLVTIEYPSCASKDDNHVQAYTKEVLNLGLLYKEFVDAIREGNRERIIQYAGGTLYYCSNVQIRKTIQLKHST